MSSFIWCEWLCSRCGYIHRTRFDLVIGLQAAYQLRGAVFDREGIFIEDIAFNLKEKPSKKRSKSRSKIYVQWDVEISKIFEAVKVYMPKYYAIKEGSLKVEVCRA